MVGAASADALPSGARPRTSTRALTITFALEQLLFCLGLFSLLPVLPVLLGGFGSHASPQFIGTALFAYTASAGLSSLAVSAALPRLSYMTSMSGGLALSGVSFGLLPYVHHPALLVALLVLAGLGYSINLVLSRVLIAELVPADFDRHRLFSTLNVAVNVAGACGPFLAVFLLASSHGDRLLLGVVAGCYVLAAVTLLFRLPGGLHPPPVTSRWPVSRRTIREVMDDRLSVRVVIATAVGAFLYAQFYSAFVLMVARQISSLPLRAVLLATPAVTIALVQAGVTAATSRLLVRGVHTFTLMAFATLVFGVGMLAVGSTPWVVVNAVTGVALFALAEMILTPTVSTAFAALPVTSRIESFNVRQVAGTCGEALGSWCGGSAFLLLLNSGHDRMYWLALGAGTLLGMPLLMATGRARSSPAVAAPPAEPADSPRPNGPGS